MGTALTGSGGTTTSFSKTPQAGDDCYWLTEDDTGIKYFDVMGNDLGGKAKMLFSLDDGGDLSDLYMQDGARCESMSNDHSALGAKIWITSDGKVGYNVDSLPSGLLQSLAAGETLTDTFRYTIRLGNGTLSWATATISYEGTNDVPVITNVLAELAGAVTEAGSTDDGTPVAGTSSVSGQLSATDVDAGATQNWTIEGTPSTTYGSIAINATTGQWTYTLDNTDADTQALKEGQSVTQTYTARVTDDFGAYVDQTITITINGTNDVPVITNVLAELAGAVTEAGSTDDGTPVAGTSSVSGQLSATDVDAGATQNWTIEGTPSTTYGSIAINATTGQWTYTLDNTDADTQALKEGQSVTQTYTARVTDDFGAYVDQTITITINGTNDVPVITNVLAELAGAVTEAGSTDDGTPVAGTSSVSGQLSATDVDAGATQNWTIEGTPSTTYGSIAINATTGQWTYTLDNTDADTQALKEGQSVTQTYTARVTDDFGAYVDQTITITINGTNDVPVITNVLAELAGAVTEAGSTDDGTPVAGTSSVSGQLSATDVDAGATQNWTIEGTPSTTYGSIAINATTGQWTYTLDNTDADTQALKEGQSVTQNYTARVTDDFGAYVDQTITITINGTNDVPVITNVLAELAGAVTEAGSTDDGTPVAGTSSVSGQLSATDVDAGATQNWTIEGTPSTTYGSIAINATTGQWTYTLDNTDADTQALKEGQSVTQNYTARVTDDFGAYVDQTITITINGTNDAPVLSDTTDPTAVAELANASAQNLSAIAGSFSVTDLDVGDTLTASVVGSPVVQLNGSSFTLPAGAAALIAGGAFTLTGTTSNGGAASIGYTYDPAAANLDFLRAGQSLTIAYTVKVNDGTTDSGTQDVKFTINGTNDQPVLSAITQPASVAELANASAQDLSPIVGSLPVNDLDVGDTLTASISGTPTLTWSGGTLTAPQITALTAAMVTEKLSFATGVLSNGGAQTIGYTYDPAAANLDFLAAGQTLTIGYAIQATDGTTPSSTQPLNFVITGTNDAPVLNAAATPVLNAVSASSSAPTGAVGTLVSSLVDLNPPAGGLDNVTDVDSGAVTGIALTATSLGGTWYYSLDNGSSWTAVGTVNDTSALLLAADANTRLYYQSTTAGTQNITFRAWDQTSGAAGTKVSTSTSGGTTAFSTATDTANITVSAATTATFGTASVSGNKTTVTITFSQAVDDTTLSVADFSYTVGSTNVVPIIQTSSFNLSKTVWTVEFDTYNGNANTTGTLTLNGSGYSFASGSAGVSATFTSFPMFPAGISGEPINLGLGETAADGENVTVTITNVPAGWTLNGGTQLADGSWTVTTDQIGALSITTPASFAGAMVLDMTMSWTRADGSTATMHVANNVEAYAPGNPIFAWSGDDALTGSAGADTFVFSQPIGDDVIHNFDVAADLIDLIGYAGFESFADVLAHTADDTAGNAKITLADGQTITLLGVSTAMLTAGNFQFDVIPQLSNSGNITIGNGAMLPMSGIIDNNGTIALESQGATTFFQLIQYGITLQGGGQLILSDNAGNMVAGTVATVTFTNVENTISGAGQLGAGTMVLVNQGTIVADGTNALVIDTGTAAVVNSGLLAATGSGGLVVASNIDNDGNIVANDSSVIVHGSLSGAGTVSLLGQSSVTIDGATSNGFVFDVGASGRLELGEGELFSGAISGFDDNDVFDFQNLAYKPQSTVDYQANASGNGGILTVSDGSHIAQVSLSGAYDAALFHISADLDQSMLVTYGNQSVIG